MTDVIQCLSEHRIRVTDFRTVLPDPRGRLPEARPATRSETERDSMPMLTRTLETDLARDQDLPARAARARFGTILIPVLVFVVLGRLARRRPARASLAAGRDSCASVCRCFVVGAHRAQRRAVARHDHLDLPRGRHPQAAARHAAPPADDPHRARAGQTAAHGGDAGADGAGGQALLPGRRRRAGRSASRSRC